MEIILGSGSPRRKQLLEAMDINFTIALAKDINEVYPDSMDHRQVPAFLSRLKAEAFLQDLTDNQLLITADTVVLLDGKILGKPAGRDAAIAMLKSLAGRTHEVISGVSLTTTAGINTFSETTEVDFAPLTEKEIEYYVDKYMPNDKAGAYGIQEWIGMVGVKAIRGCFYNVMGLPCPTLYQQLKQHYPQLFATGK